MKMSTKARSIEKIVEEQIQKWNITRRKKDIDESVYPVVTISREPGSGGRIIAESLAEKFNLDLFNQRMIHRMAESAKVSKQVPRNPGRKGIERIGQLDCLAGGLQTSLARSIPEALNESDLNHRQAWPGGHCRSRCQFYPFARKPVQGACHRPD